MHEISVGGTDCVAGGGFFANWGASQLLNIAMKYVYDSVTAGQVDYAGLAESQGTYYNMVGA